MKKEWDKAREETGNIDLVLNLIKKGQCDLIRGKKAMDYPFGLDGKQRRSSEKGEAIVEARLLSTSKVQKKCILVVDGCPKKEIEFKANAAGIGNRRKDNLIADLFGLDETGSPVAGEVKISHANPWYAVVECAAQVALLRADRKNLMEWLREQLKDSSVRGRGAWGIVVAPENYWEKEEVESAKHLVEELRKKTKIRICCVSYSTLNIFDSKQIPLKIVFGKPPTTRYVKCN